MIPAGAVIWREASTIFLLLTIYNCTPDSLKAFKLLLLLQQKLTYPLLLSNSCSGPQIEIAPFLDAIITCPSTAATNKWATLLNSGHSTPEAQVTRFDYERTGPIRPRQRRLCEQVIGDDLYLDVLNSF